MHDPQINRAIHLADRDVRRKNHLCLFPGCKRRSIDSHAIPRASLIEAIAENGFVYTHNPSWVTMIRMESSYHPIEVIKLGVNKAGVFKGYCPHHDARVFISADTRDADNKHKKRGMIRALHCRAVSLEVCRKRITTEFTESLRRRLAQSGVSLPDTSSEAIEMAENFQKAFKLSMEYFEAMLHGMFLWATSGGEGGVSYFCVVIPRNIEVSCCGVFGHAINDQPATIGYNMISYSDMSILFLTTVNTTKAWLDHFLTGYFYPGYENIANIERLLNDIAFSKGEEPLISPPLWHSLTETEQLHVRQSLRPPWARAVTSVPRVIRLTPGDFVSEPTEAMWSRFLGALTTR